MVRSTLWDWVDTPTQLLSVIVEAMWQDVRENVSYCIVDATGVLLQAKDRCDRCHFYVVVVGRRNWVFCGSDHGAVANTIAASLIASCEMHGIEPWAYLRDVLMLLPGWSQLRVLELSPKHWRATAARPDVRERLAKLHALYVCTPPAHATTSAVG